MSYVSPLDLLDSAVVSGVAKANLSIGQMLARGTLAGAILSCATTVAFSATQQTGLGLVGALVFPVGFVIIVLLGLELVTGTFFLIPLAILEGRATWRQAAKNFFFVIVGHLVGSALYLLMFSATITRMGTDVDNPMVQGIIAAAEGKTLGYEALGASGVALVVIKAILCNWMVTLGAIMALTSTTTGGKIAAMWLPVTMFFTLGFEHAVVNMFVIPAGMFLGADISIAQWWGWNQGPVLIGNFIGAITLTLALMYFSHYRSVRRPVTPAVSDAAPDAVSRAA